MEKDALEELVKQGLSTRAIAERLNTSHTTTRYWIRKYELSTQAKQSVTNYKCCQCGESDPAKFYGHKRAMCGSCHNAYNIKQGQGKRLRAVQELGGHCQACGFSLYMCSLDFHHKNPAAKDPNFRSMRGWSWKRILVELEKCTLLCKNCHAAIHNGLLQVSVNRIIGQ